MSELTPEKLVQLEEEQEKKDEQNPRAATLANQIIASLNILWTKLHQYHWYVKGPNFITLHKKFEELYDGVTDWYDEIAENLLAMGEKPASTTAKNSKYSLIKEDEADKYRSSAEMVANIVKDFRTLSHTALKAIELAEKENEVVLADTLTTFKGFLDKEIWMLQAYLGKDAKDE
ncbi:MAG: DNA starvation/stationary phase protection protein [Caldibacillus sp.]